MDPVFIQAAGQIASQGLLGALVIVLAVALYKKDRELKEQSRDNLSLLMAMQEKTFAALAKVGDLVEFIEKREDERERDRLRGRRP